MYEFTEMDIQKVHDAIQCIRKTLKCTLCHKQPMEPVTAKCGHPFCKTCVEKIVHTKKAVCSICKTVIIRSAVRDLKCVDKIIKDLNSLAEAVEKDSNTSIPLEGSYGLRQYQPKRKSLTLPGPSGIKISQGNNSRSELSTEKSEKENKGRRLREKKIERQESIDSEETIKIRNKNVAKKKIEEQPAPEPSTSRVTNCSSEHVFTADNLSVKIGTIGYKEKVEDWLYSEEFKDVTQENQSPEVVEPRTSNSSPTSEIFESFSQAKPNSDKVAQSGRNSRASKASDRKERDNGSSASTANKTQKFPSFTFEATNKGKKAIPKVVTPAEKMFDEMRKRTTDEQAENKKSNVPSVSNESSWSELARLKKETQSKVRKRRRLNVSIERPNSGKQAVESFNREDSEGEKEVGDINKVKNRKSENPELDKETNETNVEESPMKRQRPSLVSYRTLDQSEMIDIKRLNRRQVKEIIGVNLDTSKTSSNSADKSPLASNKNKLSLRWSGEHNWDISNQDERTSHFGESSKPQAKQSFHPDDGLPDSRLSSKSNGQPTPKKNILSLRGSAEHSRDNSKEKESTSQFGESSRPQSKQSLHLDDGRPGSRLSYVGNGKPASEKFRLSTKKRSPTPNIGLPEVSKDRNAARPREEEQEKITLGSDSPVRVSNDFIRNKLSLKNQRLSSDSSRATDRQNINSTNVSIKKMGKLYKPRKRIKFRLLGSTRSSMEKKRIHIRTRNIATQTSPGLANADRIPNDSGRKHLSSESMARIIIPETRTASAASSDSKRIEKAIITTASSFGKTVASHESIEEFDTVNKVNMLSPEKDSQLQFLAVKSPSVPIIGFTNSDDSVKRMGKSCTVMRETSFTNSGVATPGRNEYLRAVEKNAEQLIVTDSEDQDTPNESLRMFKRRNNGEAEKNKSDEGTRSATTSTLSKTMSNLSNTRMEDKIETAASRDVININKSPSVHNVRSNSKGKLSHVLPKRKRYSRDSLESPAKKHSAEKLRSLTKASGSNREKSPQSDAEMVLLKKVKQSEDSEGSMISARYKVVRKLKYSEESGLTANTETGKSQSSEQQMARSEKKKSNCMPEQKTFHRIRPVSSSDSEDELLEISLTTKQSSSNSQPIARPELSLEVNKSPIPSEDMTVVFSSNKDTQESKRKRSPSPNFLDNIDLQAIASNWCADLDRSSEEIAVASDRVLGLSKNLPLDGALPKKARVEAQESPALSSSDKFPALSPTAIYGTKSKGNDEVETAMETNSRSSNNEERAFIDHLEEVAARFDGIGVKIQPERSGRSLSETNSVLTKSNTRHISLVANTECSILEQENTFGGIVAANKNSTPIKAKSLEGRDLSAVHQQSQNSDKENELGNRGVKKRVDNTEASVNTWRKISTNEDLNKLEINCKSYEKPGAGNASKSNLTSVPSKTNSTNNTELFESSFDRDCLNITQEQMLMQEVEDNLLGRKSKDTMKNISPETRQEKAIQKSADENEEKASAGKEPAINDANQKAKAYQIAQIDTDDSGTMDEDIVESTPEKDLPWKKDPYTQTENSQRLNLSLKSFMSVDMTPIPKTIPKYPLLEPSSKRSSNNSILSKNSDAHPSHHSTPKSTTSIVRKISLSKKSGSPKTVMNQERRLCFVCSCLTLPQVQTVKAFAHKHNMEYTANYKPEVTHVIVQTNDRDSAGRTLKYLLGVAHKKWIVSYRWVTDSMTQNRILEEEDYEAVDSDTEEPGPRRSRLSKKGLFDEFAFVCMEPFTDITVGQLQDLLSSTGGTVVHSLEKLASVMNKHRVILYNSEIHEQGVLENWRKKSCALPVQVEWVLSCISQYELVSFRYYLQNLDPDLLSGLGLPPELIAEVEDSCSADEASS